MAFNAGDIEARATLDRDPFQRGIDAAIREGRRFASMKFEATLDANKRPFIKAVNEARAAGLRFSQRDFKTTLSADRTQFARAMRTTQADVRRLDRQDIDIPVDLDDRLFKAKARTLEERSRVVGIEVANNFRSPLRRIKWPAIFAAITAGAVAVPPAFMGVTGAAIAMTGALWEPIQVFSSLGKVQEKIAAGGEDAALAIEQYNEALAGLTQPGRQFVKQLIAMQDEMDRFQEVMQRRVLPGFTHLLGGIEEAAPAITRGSAAIGDALSRVTARAGEMFRSPVFQGQLTQAFENSVPVIEAAGDAIFNLFRDMTEFTAQTKSLGQGLGEMINSLSRGLTKFFTVLIPFSDTLGSSFAALGGIAEDMLGALGRFTGIISTGTAPGLEGLRSALQDVYNVATLLLEGAMPGLTNAWLGITTAVSGAMAALGPIAPLLGTLTGQIAPFVIALKAVDLITFGRIGSQFKALKGNVSAGAGAMDKLGIASQGLLSLAFGPLGIAVGVLGSALMILGMRQQEAAQRAAEHKAQVQALTQAIIEDGGVIGEAARNYQLKKAADEGVIDSAKRYGVGLADVKAALLGDEQATIRVTGAIEAMRKRQALAVTGTGEMAARHGDARDKAIEHERGLRILNGQITGFSRAAQAAQQAALREAAAINGVTVAVLKQINALIRLHSAKMAMIDASLALQEAQLGLKQAHKASTQALRQHGRQSMEYRQAALSEQRAIQAVLEATHRKTLETSKATGAEAKQEDAIRATDRAAMRMAQTYRGQLPPVLRTYIGGMTKSQAAAAGARVETDRVGRAVVRLPNGKVIRLRANSAPFWSSISRILQTPLYKTLTLTVDASALHGIAGQEAAMIRRGGTQPRAKGAIDVHGYANGGMTFRGRLVKQMASGLANMVPPNTPRLIGDHTSKVESFIPHDGSRRSISLLRETNRRMGNPLGARDEVRVPVAPVATAPAPVQNIYRFEPGSVVLDASGIRDIQDLLAMFDKLRQTARAHGARASTRGQI